MSLSSSLCKLVCVLTMASYTANDHLLAQRVADANEQATAQRIILH